MTKKDFDIDLVYLWVDGSDPAWRAKRNTITGEIKENSETNCKGRFANNDELKYSLRSVEKYAPWIRKIFIVTDNQIPDWLDTTNPKIKIVDHKEIMPEDSLPCFNASVIEYFLYKIPDLSEHFLFSNDDMFFNADVSPDFFFAEDGFPIIRLRYKFFGKLRYWLKLLRGKLPGQYNQLIRDASLLVEKRFGKYYSAVPHHNIDAYRKVHFQEVIENIFREQVEKSQSNHFRTRGDFHRSAISLYMLITKRGHLKYITRQESMQISAHKADFMKRLLRYQPMLLCLNDGQRVRDADRARIKPFLEEVFSVKSMFEK